jgi:hypothetical protein
MSSTQETRAERNASEERPDLGRNYGVIGIGAVAAALAATKGRTPSGGVGGSAPTGNPAK